MNQAFSNVPYWSGDGVVVYSLDANSEERNDYELIYSLPGQFGKPFGPLIQWRFRGH
ncbi:hypothetical protein [Spirosoma pulveris]